MSLRLIFGFGLWLASLYFGFVMTLAVQMGWFVDVTPPGWNSADFLGPVFIGMPVGAMLSGLAAFARPEREKIGVICFSIPVAFGILVSLRGAHWSSACGQVVCIGGVFWAAILSARLNRKDEAVY